jgi:hypothetical protein
MTTSDEQERDWHAGVRQAQRVTAAAPTLEVLERVWRRALPEVTGPDDGYWQGFTGCLGHNLDEWERWGA